MAPQTSSTGPVKVAYHPVWLPLLVGVVEAILHRWPFFLVSRESTACTNLCALQGFLKKRSPQEAATLRQLYAQSFPDLYRFSVQNLEYKTDLLEAFVIAQSTHMLQGLIPPKVNRPAPWRRSPLLSEPHHAKFLHFDLVGRECFKHGAPVSNNQIFSFKFQSLLIFFNLKRKGEGTKGWRERPIPSLGSVPTCLHHQVRAT